MSSFGEYRGPIAVWDKSSCLPDRITSSRIFTLPDVGSLITSGDYRATPVEIEVIGIWQWEIRFH